MKLFLLLTFSLSMGSLCAASTTKVDLANIYADGLIDEFDNELKRRRIFHESQTSMMESEVYAKLMAARDFIENSGSEPLKYGTKGLVQVTDVNSYFEVVDQINTSAKALHELRKKITDKKNQNLVLYPSVGPEGNVTGNTFPTNVWSLTFDDGPHESRTNEVVDNLYLHRMSATFFVLMRQVNKYPKAIDYILNADMELALHSYNHLNLDKVDEKTMEYEIGTSKKELEDKYSKKIKVFRLPYGSGMRNKALRKTIARSDLVHIFWNVDTLDWKDKDPQSIFERTKLQMENTPNKSGIILFHDVHKQSVIASEMVMNYLNVEDKTVCKVGEVINFINNQEQSCL